MSDWDTPPPWQNEITAVTKKFEIEIKIEAPIDLIGPMVNKVEDGLMRRLEDIHRLLPVQVPRIRLWEIEPEHRSHLLRLKVGELDKP